MTKGPNESPLETGDDCSQGVHPQFDDRFLLDEPARGTRLIREFYEQYSEPRNYKGRGGQHEKIKAEFFQKTSMPIITTNKHRPGCGLSRGRAD